MEKAQGPVVIGAGWSGLACALQLVQQGHRPIVLDAAPQVGGRARALEHELGGTRLMLDNGQHLLLGAYRETIALLTLLGTGALLARSPFTLRYPDGWLLCAAGAPAPWNLLLGLMGARKMRMADRWSLAGWLHQQRSARWEVPAGATAAQWLSREPRELVRRLWRPLCLGALNAAPELASAALLRNVLRESLDCAAAASNFLVPRTDLTTLFPAAAARWLQARGAQLRLHAPVLGLRARAGGGWQVQLRDHVIDAAQVVLAVPADRAAALLANTHAAIDPAVALLRRVRHAPICTVYLRYHASTRLAHPMFALLDDAAGDRYGQWVFDRGASDESLPGVLSVVISGDGPHMALGRGALGQSVARQLRFQFGLPEPLDQYTIVEKHATVAATPDLVRPAARLPAPGLFLAGDAADSPYPSTIEGSVRAGLVVARAIA